MTRIRVVSQAFETTIGDVKRTARQLENAAEQIRTTDRRLQLKAAGMDAVHRSIRVEIAALCDCQGTASKMAEVLAAANNQYEKTENQLRDKGGNFITKVATGGKRLR